MKKFKAAVLMAASLFVNAALAFDPAVEISEQADKAFRQFELTWSGKLAPAKKLLDSEKLNQSKLYRWLPDPTIKPKDLCDGVAISEEQVAMEYRITQLYAEFRSVMDSEKENFEVCKKQYSEATSRGASYDTKISYYEKLVWSRARMRMLYLFSEVFDQDAAFQTVRAQNNCAIEQLLSSNNQSVDKEQLRRLRDLMTERNPKASAQRFYEIYHDTLSIILSFP